jgi:hypothetical protein
MTNLPAIPETTITALDNAVKSGAISAVGDGFARTFATANAIHTLRALLTPDVMKNIMELQNSPLGFMTDRKDAPYSAAVVTDCIIEATLNGVSPFGNEFNIIASRCYITKNGMKHKLRDVDGLSYTITPGLPRMAGDGAIVAMAIEWEYNGTKNKKEINFAIRVNKGMGADAIIGKATRKASAWLFEAVTGTTINEGEADDAIPTTATTVASPIESAPVSEPADGVLPM